MVPYHDLDLQLSAEAQALKHSLHTIAKAVLRPAAQTLDQQHPTEVIASTSALRPTLAKLYAEKLHTLLIPEVLGGLGLDGSSLHIALEELGWGSADFAISLAVTGFPFASLAQSGDAQLIETWVKPFVANRDAQLIGCWALTEPLHGSDHFTANGPAFSDPAIYGQTTARKVDEGYVLNGSKADWISNGTLATHAVVHVSLQPELGMAGNGIAFVPLDLPGVSKGAPLDKLGQRGLNQGSIHFNEVRIPSHFLLVPPSYYAAALRQTLCLTNAAMGAIFTGVARAAYEEALHYTQQRVQGGKRLCDHQLVRKYLFEMFTKVTNARLLSRAAFRYNTMQAETRLEYAIAAKVYCTQIACEVTDTALQLHGGRGLSKGYLVEKLYRDARAALIEDGSNDVLTLVGAEELLQQATHDNRDNS